MSSIRFLEKLTDYYKSSPDDISSDESSDEVIKAVNYKVVIYKQFIFVGSICL